MKTNNENTQFVPYKCVKTSYATEQFALADIQRINKISTRDNKPVRAYYCNTCKSWHLTSRPDIHEIIKDLALMKEENEKLKQLVETLSNL